MFNFFDWTALGSALDGRPRPFPSREPSTVCEPGRSDLETATLAAGIVLRYRAAVPGHCNDRDCPYCTERLRDKLLPVVSAGRTIEMVMPSFPFKCPLRTKTLSDDADKAEQVAVAEIASLTKDIRAIYAAGACFHIASDGQVFLPVFQRQGFNVTDAHSKSYATAIRKMVAELGADDSIRVVELDQFYTGPAEHRMHSLLSEYQPSSEAEVLDSKNRSGSPEYLHLRAFFESDLMDLKEATGRSESNRFLRKELAPQFARSAMHVSGAWSNLIADKFPGALRFSLHPICLHSTQSGQEKIALSFGGSEPWFAQCVHAMGERTKISPWRAVWVEDEATGHGCRMKHWVAREIGATLVTDQHGKPSHYVMRE